MPTSTNNFHIEHIRRGHTGARMNAKFTRLHARPIVQSPDALHIEFLKQTVFYHRLAAPAAFFCWLENKIDSAVKIPRFSQILGRAQKHCCMAIVTASMHPPRVL